MNEKIKQCEYMEMDTKYFIVCDYSGSMVEYSKFITIRKLINTINDLKLIDNKYKMINEKFYMISNSISEVDFDQVHMDPANKFDFTLFENFIQTHSRTNIVKILFLTDGIYTSDEINSFVGNILSIDNVLIIPVSVGIDADISKLHKISTDNLIFRSNDIIQAYDYLIERFLGKNIRPKKLSDLIFLNIDEDSKESDEDEW